MLTVGSRVEKYRPVYLDDVVGNSETIERLKIIAKDGNMPHVIISGMPGIGKTTSILCLARTLLGDAYKEAVLELNASDERGIDVVRNRIKGFAQKKVTLPPGRHKLVILDEADRYVFLQDRRTKTEELTQTQHDIWCATSITKNYGDLLEHNPFCLCLQSIKQNH